MCIVRRNRPQVFTAKSLFISARSADKMNVPSYTRNTCLKNVRPQHLKPVYDMLDVREKYKKLASKIKKRNGKYMFTTDEIELLDNEFLRKGSPSKAVFARWRYDNPNIGAVVALLEKCRLVREAEHITQHWLREQYVYEDKAEESEEAVSNYDTISVPCEEPLKSAHDPEEHDEMADTPSYSGEMFTPWKEEEETTMVKISADHSTDSEDLSFHPAFRQGVRDFTYEELLQCTKYFNEKLLNEGGSLIGTGGFAKVYLGIIDNHCVAVKKMTLDTCDSDILEYQYRQFEAEVNILTGFNHKNLLKVFGKCIEETCLCIVSEYMENGSLEDMLACKSGPPLTIPERMNILVGAAEGLCYLHQKGKIHRDVKSANVLLTCDLIPKIADCGLTRHGPSDPLDTHIVTDTITGTRGYMPPEYYEGKVSVKMDAFAFGVVILEVITGQSNYSASRKEVYLKRFVQEHCEKDTDIMDLTDSKCGPWVPQLVVELYQMASEIFHDSRKIRKEISDILPGLKQLSDNAKILCVQ